MLASSAVHPCISGEQLSLHRHRMLSDITEPEGGTERVNAAHILRWDGILEM